MRFFVLIPAVLFLLSCSPFAPLPKGGENPDLPGSYSVRLPKGEENLRWWESFGSDELNRLVEAAFADNLDLMELSARLERAEAIAVMAQSGLYPNLTVSAGTDIGEQYRTASPRGHLASELYTARLASSWELDLWGRISAGYAAENLESRAVAMDLDAAAVTLAAEVTSSWVGLAGLAAEGRVVESMRRITALLLELVRNRFLNGLATAVEVNQQKQAVASIESRIPLIESRRKTLENRIAVLLGKAPSTFEISPPKDLPAPPPLPETGIPADLLQKRPDVRAAALRIDSFKWRLVRARADRLPALSLSASAGFGPAALDLFFENWILNITSSLVATLLDGGMKRSAVKKAEADLKIRLLQYKKVVIGAVREVEDVLVSEKKLEEQIRFMKEVEDSAQKAYELSMRRYLNGAGDYLAVLVNQKNLLDARLGLVEKEKELLFERIRLFRALGGVDWMRDKRR